MEKEKEQWLTPKEPTELKGPSNLSFTDETSVNHDVTKEMYDQLLLSNNTAYDQGELYRTAFGILRNIRESTRVRNQTEADFASQASGQTCEPRQLEPLPKSVLDCMYSPPDGSAIYKMGPHWSERK